MLKAALGNSQQPVGEQLHLMDCAELLTAVVIAGRWYWQPRFTTLGLYGSSAEDGL